MSETIDLQQVITESAPVNIDHSQDAADIKVNAVVVSHMGCVRKNNEDNFFFDGDIMHDTVVNDGALVHTYGFKRFHLFGVCDGMGGLEGGERASSIGVHEMSQLNQYIEQDRLEARVNAYALNTSARIYADATRDGGDAKEGTTMALAYIADGMVHAANVGDSRVYLMRMGKLFQLSTDHSMVYKMMQQGELTREQMRKHPRGNVIDLFMGMDASRIPKQYAAHRRVRLCMQDRIMICSDGLSDLIADAEIEQTLARLSVPMEAATRLVRRALEVGGKDNTTCIVIDVEGGKLPPATDRARDSLLPLAVTK